MLSGLILDGSWLAWSIYIQKHSLTQAQPLQLSLEAVNARLVEKTRELNVVEIENERLKVRAYVGLEHTYVCVCV